MSESKKAPSVLIVDDEVDACKLAQDLLERKGYSVTVAHSVSEASKALDQRSFEAVLLDHHMPGGDGSIIADRLLLTMKPERIIYVTADEQQSRVGNVIQFLQKPYDPRRLIQSLEFAIRSEP